MYNLSYWSSSSNGFCIWKDEFDKIGEIKLNPLFPHTSLFLTQHCLGKYIINDEYLFDENKDTKNEINDIKKLLKHADRKELERYVNDELKEESNFVFTALDFATDVIAIRELLKSDNQTLILKTAEVLKALGNFDETARTVALLKVSDINIKAIIRAL